MATIRKVAGKRGIRWRAEVCVGGVRDSDTFPSRADAKAWGSTREAELGRGGSSSARKTLADALSEYSTKVSPKHEGARWEVIRLKKIARDFEGASKPLRDLTAADIGAWRDARLRSVSKSSVAREMGLLRTVLGHAQQEWRWLTLEKLVELRGAKKPKAAAPRTQRIPDEARDAIVASLGYSEEEPPTTISQRVGLAFLLALETAMRCGELCGIRPEDMHLEQRYVTLPKSKNGDARDVPLTLEAVRLFRRGPLNLTARQVDPNFRKARDRTPWKAIHFHDARAEALTRLAAKVDILTLARIAGHRDPRSLSIYYRPTIAEIAAKL